MANAASNPTVNPPRGCILLFGMPRSGTTWLGKLFDSHPDTLYRHEPDTWRRLSMPRYPDVRDSERYEIELRAFVDDLPAMNAPRVAGKLPLFPKAYLSPSRARLIEGGVWLARLGSRIHPNFPVLMHSSASHYPHRRVVWKSIESLGRMGVLLSALPDAAAIHILRHPCGYIASVLRGLRTKNFGRRRTTGNDYGIFKAVMGTSIGDRYGLSLSELDSLTQEERIAWRWVLINEKALLDCQDTGQALCVRYEDVCRDPLARVEEMFQFVGLDVTEQTRTFVSASTSQAKDDYYSVFKDPMAAATRWQEELEPETINRIMAIVRRSRFADYYDTDPVGRAVAP